MPSRCAASSRVFAREAAIGRVFAFTVSSHDIVEKFCPFLKQNGAHNAKRGIATLDCLSVCSSICLSVKFRPAYRDHKSRGT